MARTVYVLEVSYPANRQGREECTRVAVIFCPYDYLRFVVEYHEPMRPTRQRCFMTLAEAVDAARSWLDQPRFKKTEGVATS
jgi:hypothetical protein